MAKFLEFLAGILALAIMVVLVRTYVLENSVSRDRCQVKALETAPAVQGSNSPD